MDNTLIYDRIKQLIDKSNITANKLLLDCKINSSFLNDLKSKNVTPSIEKILKISKYFNVSIDYLVTGNDNTNTSNSNIITAPINAAGSFVQGVNHSSVFLENGVNHSLTDEELELLRIYKTLDVRNRMQLLDTAFNLEEKMKGDNK